MIRIFLPGLAVLFIGLKLTGYIAWPWLLVLSPILASLAIGLLLFFLVFLIALLKD
jgi:hypothetical protein